MGGWSESGRADIATAGSQRLSARPPLHRRDKLKNAVAFFLTLSH